MLLTFFGNPWIHNVNVDQILVRLSPRSGEHASEVRTLAEIHFVQSPQFSTGADGNVRALLLLEQCLVDVLGGSQLLPAGIRTEIITLRDDVGQVTSLTSWDSSCSHPGLHSAHPSPRDLRSVSVSWPSAQRQSHELLPMVAGLG